MRPYLNDGGANQSAVPIDELMHVDLKLSSDNIVVIPNKKSFLRLGTFLVPSSNQGRGLHPLPKSTTQSFSPQVNGISFETPSSPLLFKSDSLSQNVRFSINDVRVGTRNTLTVAVRTRCANAHGSVRSQSSFFCFLSFKRSHATKRTGIASVVTMASYVRVFI